MNEIKSEAGISPVLSTDGLEAAPPNSLPTWSECALRVDNSDFIAKRVADGGSGPEPDSLLATELHRFIYEYDDADPYRSEWFLHRLELVLEEAKREASNAEVRGEPIAASPSRLTGYAAENTEKGL